MALLTAFLGSTPLVGPDGTSLSFGANPDPGRNETDTGLQTAPGAPERDARFAGRAPSSRPAGAAPASGALLSRDTATTRGDGETAPAEESLERSPGYAAPSARPEAARNAAANAAVAGSAAGAGAPGRGSAAVADPGAARGLAAIAVRGPTAAAVAMPRRGPDPDALAQSWVQRLARLDVRAPQGNATFTIPLDASWGSGGQVRLLVRGRSVTATIVVPDAASRERLEGALDELKQALLSRGFTEARLRVRDSRPGDSSERPPESREHPREGGGDRPHYRRNDPDAPAEVFGPPAPAMEDVRS